MYTFDGGLISNCVNSATIIYSSSKKMCFNFIAIVQFDKDIFLSFYSVIFGA